MNLVMVKYNSGNVRSVDYALQRLGINAIVSDDFEVLKSADRILFPGVGNAASAMQSLKEKGLDKLIPNLTQPLLGICLGMQLMCKQSEEGDTPCLGIVPLEVKKFRGMLKVPHTGWNSVYNLKGGLFGGIQENEYMYFVHAYYAERGEATAAECNYIQPFSAAIQYKNFYGVQFHPELSAHAGSRILSNFLKSGL